ncbi:MAG: sigma-70 family RNA polymerase sigma factor [Paludibacteraceae bacterium]|nr:sigma-70 family RNA polymerase sigma factor [Paludibacteraceae bacterium]
MDNQEKEFELFVRENKSTIYTVCYMFSNNKDEVDDLFQDILVNLWKGFASFRKESKIETWVYRVSMNTCISADRKKKRLGTHIPLDINLDLFNETNEDTQQVQLLYRRIHQLGLVDRALIMMWLEGLSYDEIGDILGISANNVGVKLLRLKEKLKQQNLNSKH